MVLRQLFATEESATIKREAEDIFDEARAANAVDGRWEAVQPFLERRPFLSRIPDDDRIYNIGVDLLGPDFLLTGADLTLTFLPFADLSYVNLTDADVHNAKLTYADLTGANLATETFSPGTILKDGQTVLQHGFDADGLQTHLEASPISAWNASNLNIVPKPASVFLLLTGLLTLARVRF